jgi:hypothetical protein
MKKFFSSLFSRVKRLLLIDFEQDKHAVSATALHYNMLVLTVVAFVVAYLFAASKVLLLTVFLVWLVGAVRLGKLAKNVDQELKKQYANIAALLRSKTPAPKSPKPTAEKKTTKKPKKQLLKG